MKEPREALAAARALAAAARARGGQDDPPPSLDASPVTRVSDWRLMEWAIIEPDQARVYSTRRYGQPITALKRLLIRFLRQYLDQVTAQQSRFNAHIAAHVLNLDERVQALEDVAQGEPRARGEETGSG